jgi:hypothetical protein
MLTNCERRVALTHYFYSLLLLAHSNECSRVMTRFSAACAPIITPSRFY